MKKTTTYFSANRRENLSRRWSAASLLVLMMLGAFATSAAASYWRSASSSVSVTSGSSSASAGVKLSHGWVSLSQKNVNSADFSLNGTKAGGRGAYGHINGQYLVQQRKQAPGGRTIIVGTTWKVAGTASTSRTSTRTTDYAQVLWSPRVHHGLKTIGKVCLDIVLAPDKCSSTTSFTTTF